MAATRYLSDVLQTSNCQLSEAIQNQPPELCEKNDRICRNKNERKKGNGAERGT